MHGVFATLDLKILHIPKNKDIDLKLGKSVADSDGYRAVR